MTPEKTLVTRKEIRAMGLTVSRTQFGRYEKDGLLTAIKPGGRRSARVYYHVEEVRKLLAARSRGGALNS